MTDVLCRNLAAAACIAGGALRIIAPLAQGFEPLAAQLLYLTVDALLLLGLAGLYGFEARRLGRLGLAAFTVAVIGICIIRSQGAVGEWAYPVGAAVFGAAMALLGIVGLWAQLYGRLAPASWVAAFAVGALASTFTNTVVMTAAGMVFGLGFVFAGRWLLAPPRP